MKNILLSFLFFLTISIVNGQELHVRTFGEKSSTPIIFLHGGPGYNSANFEATTARKLSDNGFFVIVYDRRGEGRSIDKNAKFTFKETFADLNSIYKKYDLKKATLIGHSFGGIVAALYTKKYRKKVNSIVLVGAPISLQETFKTILKTSKEIYIEKKDSINLNYLNMLEEMDTSSLQYSSYCFMHAMQNGFYAPKEPSEEAKNIYESFKTDTLLMKYASQMSYQAPQGFWKNEKYTTINLSKEINFLKNSNIQIFGLYGKDDGLYSFEQVEDLKELIGSENVVYLDNCSHSVFIDQQALFLKKISEWVK